MEQFVGEIAQSGWFSLASFFVGTIGIVLAVVFYRRTKRTKTLSFAHRSISIFRDSTPLMSKLQVMYQGKATTNLTLTHLAFWNSGNETIRHIDLVDNDPLHIQIAEGEVLDAELLCETHKANAILVGSPTDASVNLSFKFLDAQNGGAVRVVHTGASRRDVDLKGTLMGAGTPKAIAEGFADRMRRIIFLARSPTISRREFKWTFTFAVAIVTVGMAVFLAFMDSPSLNEASTSGPWRFAILLTLAPHWGIALAAYRRQLPRELERYLEDFGTEKKS